MGRVMGKLRCLCAATVLGQVALRFTLATGQARALRQWREATDERAVCSALQSRGAGSFRANAGPCALSRWAAAVSVLSARRPRDSTVKARGIRYRRSAALNSAFSVWVEWQRQVKRRRAAVTSAVLSAEADAFERWCVAARRLRTVTARLQRRMDEWRNRGGLVSRTDTRGGPASRTDIRGGPASRTDTRGGAASHTDTRGGQASRTDTGRGPSPFDGADGARTRHAFEALAAACRVDSRFRRRPFSMSAPTSASVESYGAR